MPSKRQKIETSSIKSVKHEQAMAWNSSYTALHKTKLAKKWIRQERRLNEFIEDELWIKHMKSHAESQHGNIMSCYYVHVIHCYTEQATWLESACLRSICLCVLNVYDSLSASYPLSHAYPSKHCWCCIYVWVRVCFLSKSRTRSARGHKLMKLMLICSRQAHTHTQPNWQVAQALGGTNSTLGTTG